VACDELLEVCDLCGGQTFRPRARYRDYLNFGEEIFTLVCCDSCSVCFLNPRPSRSQIGAYYPADYQAHCGAAPAKLRRFEKQAGGTEPCSRGLGRWALRIAQDVAWYVIPAPRGERRILDIGAGSGQLLDKMKQLGWRTAGVEPCAGAVARARAKGHEMAVGCGEDAHFPARSFDVVYLWHSLEHAHSPARVLSRAHEALAPGGQLQLAVPNFASAHARLFGSCWWSTDAPRHLFQFTASTLTAYLQRTGFRNIRITTRTGATSWLRGFRHSLNRAVGTCWRSDPGWLLALCEVPVVLSSLFRFFGVGSELRVTAEP
jgi:SAM-dependent methyltransferase